MPTHHTTDVCFNVQTVVDAKHKLIVEHEVTNAVTDQNQLAVMALRAKAVLGVESFTALADTGYYDGPQIKLCQEAGITVLVSKPHTSVNGKKGMFTKEDFVYEAQQDVYRCPAGQALGYRFDAVELGREIGYYATSACKGCALRERCTVSRQGRRITRWKYEHLLEEMAVRVREHPELMKQRKEVVEHPFGTIKRSMVAGYFLLRGLSKVGAEMSLTVLCYNLRRVINLVGVARLMAALG
jgi:hypothetical protein